MPLKNAKPPSARSDRDAVIVSATRTAIGRRGGIYTELHPHELLAPVLSAALRQAATSPDQLDLVIAGCVSQVGEQSYNIGRLAALSAGFPIEVPGITLDAQCGSSQQAVNAAAAMVESGSANVVLACGVESMTRIPLGTARSGPGDPLSPAYRERFDDISPGESAERIAERWAVTRSDADAWALRSQRRASDARDSGRFHDEITPVVAGESISFHDEGIRDTTAERLASLRPAFRDDGVHTAASSSQISDGAAAVVVMSRRAARQLGATPLARVVGQTIVGVDPVLRLTGPIPVTARLLSQHGMTADDIDLFEVNEAFASVVLAWLEETGADADRVNVNGGAIALGHPVGATGARLITSMVHELRRRDATTGMVAMCCGTGLGTGTLLVRER